MTSVAFSVMTTSVAFSVTTSCMASGMQDSQHGADVPRSVQTPCPLTEGPGASWAFSVLGSCPVLAEQGCTALPAWVQREEYQQGEEGEGAEEWAPQGFKTHNPKWGCPPTCSHPLPASLPEEWQARMARPQAAPLCCLLDHTVAVTDPSLSLRAGYPPLDTRPRARGSDCLAIASVLTPGVPQDALQPHCGDEQAKGLR